MNIKKRLRFLRIALLASMMPASVTSFAEGAWTDDMYNPREEVEYSYRATMDRQTEENQQIQFQQYQQKQYFEQQRSMNQQDLYNQIHQNSGPDYAITNRER